MQETYVDRLWWRWWYVCLHSLNNDRLDSFADLINGRLIGFLVLIDNGLSSFLHLINGRLDSLLYGHNIFGRINRRGGRTLQ